jgi:hypothetical protein
VPIGRLGPAVAGGAALVIGLEAVLALLKAPSLGARSRLARPDANGRTLEVSAAVVTVRAVLDVAPFAIAAVLLGVARAGRGRRRGIGPSALAVAARGAVRVRDVTTGCGQALRGVAPSIRLAIVVHETLAFRGRRGKTGTDGAAIVVRLETVLAVDIASHRRARRVVVAHPFMSDRDARAARLALVFIGLAVLPADGCEDLGADALVGASVAPRARLLAG